MNKLHKFNEHWADDELADTNQRLANLDNEEGIDYDDPEIASPEEEELVDLLLSILGQYSNKVSPTDISTILTDLAKQPELWTRK